MRAFDTPRLRLNPTATCKLLASKCDHEIIDLVVVFRTLADSCAIFELTDGQRVRDHADFHQFFREMADLIEAVSK